MIRRLLVIGAGIVLVAGGITWYVVGFLTVSPPAVTVPAQTGAVPTAELTLQTVASLGGGFSQPSWVSYLVKNTSGTWVHSTDLHAAGPRARPRDHLPVRQRDRTAERVFRPPRGRRRQQDPDRREDRRRDQPEPDLAHVRRPGAAPGRPAPGRRRQREEHLQPGSVLARDGAPDDHVLVPDGRARTATAGSASSPAPPASSSASAGRCRRSATWTGS